MSFCDLSEITIDEMVRKDMKVANQPLNCLVGLSRTLTCSSPPLTFRSQIELPISDIDPCLEFIADFREVSGFHKTHPLVKFDTRFIG